MKIGIIDYLAGTVLINGSPAKENQELNYTDEIDATNGTCIVKFLKSMRLEDVSRRKLNLGGLAKLHEKAIVIKNGSGF